MVTEMVLFCMARDLHKTSKHIYEIEKYTFICTSFTVIVNAIF
jgi:hypothetical protein